jgi:hypothetical protein
VHEVQSTLGRVRFNLLGRKKEIVMEKGEEFLQCVFWIERESRSWNIE